MIGWVKINKVIHTIYFPVLKTVSGEIYGEAGETEGKLHPSVIEQIQAGGSDAPVFVRHADGMAFSACQILGAAASQGLDLFTEVPDDGTKVRKQGVIQFTKGLFYIQTTLGPRDLRKLILGVDIYAKKTLSPLPEKGFCYHGTGRPATYGIETEAEVLGKEILVSFHKQVNSIVLTMTVTKQTNKR
jgi:hypothetical protein